MKILPPIAEVKKFLIIFYGVGLLGFSIPYTQPLFIILTPLALVLNFGLLFYYHQKWLLKDIILVLTIALLTFFIEVIGVKTGMLFGTYSYGNVLGPKIFNTPILIGLNWLVLVYSMGLILQPIVKNIFLSALIGSLGITLFDWIMEPVAIFTGMWLWKDNVIPVQNYIMWFFVALIFLFLFQIMGKKIKNPMAPWLLFTQLGFFGGLHILIKLFLS